MPDQMLTATVDIPARFYQDHCGRDLPGGNPIKTLNGGRTVRVILTRADYDELLDDARHYSGREMAADLYADDFAWASGLIRSAKATVRALEAVTRP